MLIANAGDGGCGRLNDSDIKGIADSVTGHNMILQVLSDAAIGFAGQDCRESLLILARLHFQRFINEPAVRRGVKHLYRIRQRPGDIDLKLNLSSRRYSGVTRLNGLQHGAGGDCSSRKRERPQQADGFGAEHSIQAGQQCHHEQDQAQPHQPASVNDLINVHGCQSHGGPFFQSFADGNSGLPAVSLQVYK